jgi:hypothetical protein
MNTLNKPKKTTILDICSIILQAFHDTVNSNGHGAVSEYLILLCYCEIQYENTTICHGHTAQLYSRLVTMLNKIAIDSQ